MSKHFKLRTYQRASLCGRIYYLSEDFLGKGTVWDLSPGGWRIQGDHRVRLGQLLSLRLESADQEPPLEIDQAVVQWVNGQDFGVRINKIRPAVARRLKRLADDINTRPTS